MTRLIPKQVRPPVEVTRVRIRATVCVGVRSSAARARNSASIVELDPPRRRCPHGDRNGIRENEAVPGITVTHLAHRLGLLLGTAESDVRSQRADDHCGDENLSCYRSGQIRNLAPPGHEDHLLRFGTADTRPCDSSCRHGIRSVARMATGPRTAEVDCIDDSVLLIRERILDHTLPVTPTPNDPEQGRTRNQHHKHCVPDWIIHAFHLRVHDRLSSASEKDWRAPPHSARDVLPLRIACGLSAVHASHGGRRLRGSGSPGASQCPRLPLTLLLTVRCGS